MLVEMLVLEESERSFQTKNRGMQIEYGLSLRDASQGERCTNNFTYALSPEEKDKFKGKLRDNRVVLVVKRIVPGWSGDLRIEGRLEPIGAKGGGVNPLKM